METRALFYWQRDHRRAWSDSQSDRLPEAPVPMMAVRVWESVQGSSAAGL